MKVIVLFLFLAYPSTLLANTCEVEICNKLKRVTFSISSYIEDQLGETCFNTVIPKEDAVKGKILTSESRWYQGSFNPTKKSVTKINKIIKCEK